MNVARRLVIKSVKDILCPFVQALSLSGMGPSTILTVLLLIRSIALTVLFYCDFYLLCPFVQESPL
jgi:hypothetical protein